MQRLFAILQNKAMSFLATLQEEKIQNSNSKHPVSKSLNSKLITYIRYSCIFRSSGSVTVYLGKQIIPHLPTTGL